MDVKLLKGCGNMVSYKLGQAICREGEEGQSMFVLLRGMVTVVIGSFSDNPQGVDQLGEGSFFGEMSLLEGKPRSATVMARTDDVLVLEVSEEDFFVLLRTATSLAFRLLTSLSSRLDAMLLRIEETDRPFAFRYRRDRIYQTIQKMDLHAFEKVAETEPDYVWTLLRYLSSSLEKLNREFLQRVKPEPLEPGKQS